MLGKERFGSKKCWAKIGFGRKKLKNYETYNRCERKQFIASNNKCQLVSIQWHVTERKSRGKRRREMMMGTKGDETSSSSREDKEDRSARDKEEGTSDCKQEGQKPATTTEAITTTKRKGRKRRTR